MMVILQWLKWVNWAVLVALAFVLLFTGNIIAWLEIENTLQNVLILIVPLIAVAIGLEWMTRQMAK